MHLIPRTIVILFTKILIFSVFAAVILTGNIAGRFRMFPRDGQHFSLLAESFIKGHLNFQRLDILGTLDMTEKDGKLYWHEGPFPAILLMPFVYISSLFGTFFYQGYLHIFVIIGVFILCFLIARKFGFGVTDSYYLSGAFCFASLFVYIILDSRSWFFSQGVGVFFSLLAIYEYKTKSRWWLIGIYSSFVLATRISAGMIILFFVLTLIFNKKRRLITGSNIKKISQLLIPYILVLSLIFLYNFVRFGNIFMSGYEDNYLLPAFDIELRARFGVFNFRSILTNFYWYFLAPLFPLVEPNTYHLTFPYVGVSPIGVSFFVVSPVFIRIFKYTWKNTEQKFIWLASLLILFMILTFYSAGYYQFGPRYILDLLPLWYLLLLYSWPEKRFGTGMKLLIFVSAIFNLYLIYFSMIDVLV